MNHGGCWLPRLVQELAADVQEPPGQYLQREQGRPGGQLADAELPEPIPTVDLSRLSAFDSRRSHQAAVGTAELGVVPGELLSSYLRSWSSYSLVLHRRAAAARGRTAGAEAKGRSRIGLSKWASKQGSHGIGENSNSKWLWDKSLAFTLYSWKSNREHNCIVIGCLFDLVEIDLKRYFSIVSSRCTRVSGMIAAQAQSQLEVLLDQIQVQQEQEATQPHPQE